MWCIAGGDVGTISQLVFPYTLLARLADRLTSETSFRSISCRKGTPRPNVLRAMVC